ncbi:hypothetical protein UA44_11880, partial [Klebsiella aerogenes]
MQLNAAGVPDAEALARGTAKVGGNRVGGQPLVAVSLGDITGQRRANGTVGVANIEPERLLCLLSTYGFACCSSCALSTPLSNGGLLSVQYSALPAAAHAVS